MICLSKRTVLFCCVLVVTLASVAGRKSDTNDEFVPDISPRFDIHEREALLPEDCGIPNPVPRVYGGSNTGRNEHPWMALIIINSNRNFTQYVCGGTLISRRYVLTNAFCTYAGDWVPDGVYLKHVILGAWNITAWKDCPGGHDGGCDPPHQEIEVETAISHEMYNDSQRRYDIGLLRLKSDVEFTEYVKPICLPLTNGLKQSVTLGEDLTLVGYGQLAGDRHAADVKQKVQLRVVSTSSCARLYQSDELHRKRIIDGTQICAGGTAGMGSCNGDGGGPLMGKRGPKWILFGISSFTRNPCALPDWPEVFTRVGAFTDWILHNLKP